MSYSQMGLFIRSGLVKPNRGVRHCTNSSGVSAGCTGGSWSSGSLLIVLLFMPREPDFSVLFSKYSKRCEELFGESNGRVHNYSNATAAHSARIGVANGEV